MTLWHCAMLLPCVIIFLCFYIEGNVLVVCLDSRWVVEHTGKLAGSFGNTFSFRTTEHSLFWMATLGDSKSLIVCSKVSREAARSSQEWLRAEGGDSNGLGGKLGSSPMRTLTSLWSRINVCFGRNCNMNAVHWKGRAVWYVFFPDFPQNFPWTWWMWFTRWSPNYRKPGLFSNCHFCNLVLLKKNRVT
jgi:hypothetical protein